jgi:hypothetical protein
MTTELQGNYPDRLQRDDKISMVGEDPRVGALQKAMIKPIDKVGMGQIELEYELEPKCPNPILVVKVGGPSPVWAPFFAMSQFSIQTGYATNGILPSWRSWIGLNPIFAIQLPRSSICIRKMKPEFDPLG